MLFGLALGFFIGVAIFVVIFLLIGVFSVLINQVYCTLLHFTLIEKKKVKGFKLKSPKSFFK